jgi:hypothetical protein
VEVIPLDDVCAQDLAAAFREFVNEQRARWQREARAGRSYDVMEATARRIGFLSRGVGPVWVAIG